jgi:hypothetical protein
LNLRELATLVSAGLVWVKTHVAHCVITMESFCGAQVPRISTDSALLEDFAEELDGFVSPATLDEE